jgi:hypothetical protein
MSPHGVLASRLIADKEVLVTDRYRRPQNAVRPRWITLVSIALVVTFATASFGAAPVAWAMTDSERLEQSPSGAGLGAASWFLTIPYGVGKVAFALFGGIIGGFAYPLTGGNMEISKAIWQTSMYGSYVVTPEHLRGDKPLRFLGQPDTASGTAAPAPGAP